MVHFASSLHFDIDPFDPLECIWIGNYYNLNKIFVKQNFTDLLVAKIKEFKKYIYFLNNETRVHFSKGRRVYTWKLLRRMCITCRLLRSLLCLRFCIRGVSTFYSVQPNSQKQRPLYIFLSKRDVVLVGCKRSYFLV